MVTEIETQEELQKLVDGVVKDFQDMKFEPLLQRFFRKLEDESSVRFKKQTAPDGVPWALLAPSTIKRKKHDIRLYETGRLRGSLTTPNQSEGLRETWDIWPKAGLIFGTAVPYGMFHETGGPNLPRRPFMGTSEYTIDKFTEQTADYVLAELVQ